MKYSNMIGHLSDTYLADKLKKIYCKKVNILVYFRFIHRFYREKRKENKQTKKTKRILWLLPPPPIHFIKLSSPAHHLLFWIDLEQLIFLQFSAKELPYNSSQQSSVSFTIKARSQVSAWLPQSSLNAFHSSMHESEKQVRHANVSKLHHLLVHEKA